MSGRIHPMGFVRAVAGAPLMVLMTLAMTGRPMRNREIQTWTGYSENTVHDCLGVLMAMGCVRACGGRGPWAVVEEMRQWMLGLLRGRALDHADPRNVPSSEKSDPQDLRIPESTARQNARMAGADRQNLPLPKTTERQNARNAGSSEPRNARLVEDDPQILPVPETTGPKNSCVGEGRNTQNLRVPGADRQNLPVPETIERQISRVLSSCSSSSSLKYLIKDLKEEEEQQHANFADRGRPGAADGVRGQVELWKAVDKLWITRSQILRKPEEESPLICTNGHEWAARIGDGRRKRPEDLNATHTHGAQAGVLASCTCPGRTPGSSTGAARSRYGATGAKG